MLGYVLYSTYSNLVRRRSPSDRAAVAVAVAAVLPDLIDKPLAWQFAILPGGRSLAHSLVFAVPAVLIVGYVARRSGAPDVGGAFAVAYLSHLPADSFYPLVSSGHRADFGYLIWPFASAGGSGSVLVVDHVFDLILAYAALVTGPDAWRFLLLEGTLLTLTVGLWIVDGRPGLGTIRRGFRWVSRAQ